MLAPELIPHALAVEASLHTALAAAERRLARGDIRPRQLPAYEEVIRLRAEVQASAVRLRGRPAGTALVQALEGLPDLGRGRVTVEKRGAWRPGHATLQFCGPGEGDDFMDALVRLAAPRILHIGEPQPDEDPRFRVTFQRGDFTITTGSEYDDRDSSRELCAWTGTRLRTRAGYVILSRIGLSRQGWTRALSESVLLSGVPNLLIGAVTLAAHDLGFLLFFNVGVPWAWSRLRKEIHQDGARLFQLADRVAAALELTVSPTPSRRGKR